MLTSYPPNWHSEIAYWRTVIFGVDALWYEDVYAITNMLWSLILRNIVSICNGYTNHICGYVTGKMANHFAMVWSLYLLYNFLEIKHYLHTPWAKLR